MNKVREVVVNHIIGKLRYKILGLRLIDLILVSLKGFIWILLTVNGVLFINLLKMIFFGSIEDRSLSIWYVLFVLFCIYSSLYIGFCHTNITSQQRYRLFSERTYIDRNDRANTAKKYLGLSFMISILYSCYLILLVTNYYLLSFVNNMYDNVIEFLSQNGTPFLTPYVFDYLVLNKIWNLIFLSLPTIAFLFFLYNTYQKDARTYSRFYQSFFEKRYYNNLFLYFLVHDVTIPKYATSPILKGTNILRKRGHRYARPDVLLGIDSQNNQPVVIKYNERNLSTAIIGPTGTGKSQAFLLPESVQDVAKVVDYVHAYADFIRKNVSDFNEIAAARGVEVGSEFYKNKLREAYLKINDEWINSGVASELISGLYVNEPSGELIKSIYKIILETGFPRQMIWKINPAEEDTEGINIFDASIDQASSLMVDIVGMFVKDSSLYFQGRGRIYIRNAVILIMASARLEGSYLDKDLLGDTPGFEELAEFVEDSEVIKKRLQLAEVYLAYSHRVFDEKYRIPYQELYKQEEAKYLSDPENEPALFRDYITDHLPDLAELEIKYEDAKSDIGLVEQAVTYFRNGFVTDRNGNEFFAHAEHAVGAIDPVRELAGNKYIRRIFFRKSTKSLDTFLRQGGFVLFSSARGTLGDNDSKTIGRIMELLFHNATFRRVPDKSPYYGYKGDEGAWVIMPQHEQYFNQSRKYKIIATFAFQNEEQIIAELGKEKTQALLNSFRNIFIYQDSSPETIEKMVKAAGTEERFEIQRTMSDGDFLEGEVHNSRSIRESVTEVSKVTADKLRTLDRGHFFGSYQLDGEVVSGVEGTPIPFYQTTLYKLFDPTNDVEDGEIFDIWLEQSRLRYLESRQQVSVPLTSLEKEEQEVVLGKYSDSDVLETSDETERSSRSEVNPFKGIIREKGEQTLGKPLTEEASISLAKESQNNNDETLKKEAKISPFENLTNTVNIGENQSDADDL